ncbi:MAG: DNA repair protein RadC [Elusimicrobiaceae bacterium]|nr:DNA repair protein RadC [Elusimicrobiaceae bacterium]
MEKPSYLGHRDRIKNKFKKEGLKPFLDHEVLELLLTYSIPRKDTKKLAWDLLKTFGTLSGVLESSNFELRKVKGIGPQSALLINFIREIITRYTYDKVQNRCKISNHEDLYNYCMAHLQNKKLECFEVLFLDIKHRLIAAEILSHGTVDSTTIYPRRLIELILKHGAKSIICVHNHPSGDPSPSFEDEIITKNIKEALKILAVELDDHIIVGNGKIYSFRTGCYIQKPKLFL